jgi:hypothetical protein
VANVLTIDRQTDADWYTAGDYVLFYTPADGLQFRQIASVSGNQLTLAVYGPGIAYGTGSVIWPCRECIREAAGINFVAVSEDSQEEKFHYLTL